jgi:hypothetical protein
MPPANDNFANAHVISGDTGSLSSNNNGATTEVGEPNHFIYNPGPSYPVVYTPPEGVAGPSNTVWYQWTCPGTYTAYFFSTLSPNLVTNFKTCLNIYTGTAVNALTRVTTLMDQSSGDGWGANNGASIAFQATPGTVYYIQIDSRVAGATGNFFLSWGQYSRRTLGDCGAALNFNADVQCLGTVQPTTLSQSGTLNCPRSQAACPSFWSFGSVTIGPGNYAVALISGTPIASGTASGVSPYGIVCDGDATGIGLYDGGAFSVGAKVLQAITGDAWVSDCLVVSGNPPSAGGIYWDNYPLGALPSTCQIEPIHHTQTGVIGIVTMPSSGWVDGPQNPTYQLLYYPFTIGMLSVSQQWPSFTGSGTMADPWTIEFNIQNLSSQDWDNCTVALLNAGGIAGASAALTGFDIAASSTVTTSPFTFSANPSSGLMTANLQISRNGIVVGTLLYPLYPVAYAYFYGGFFVHEYDCGGGQKMWESSLGLTYSWPSAMSMFPSAWGQTINYVFSVSAGTVNWTNADPIGYACGPFITNLTGSYGYIIGLNPWFQGGTSPNPITVQCLLSYNGVALPTFTQNITVPPA